MRERGERERVGERERQRGRESKRKRGGKGGGENVGERERENERTDGFFIRERELGKEGEKARERELSLIHISEPTRQS